MEEVVITSAIRTPIGGFQGELDCFSASDLGGMAIDGAMTVSYTHLRAHET